MCRFTNGSYHAKALMESIRSCFENDFSLYFIIEEGEDHEVVEVQRIVTGEMEIRNMCLRGSFEIDVTIPVYGEMASTTISLCISEKPYPDSDHHFLPISGFPRTFLSDDKKFLAQG